MGLTEKSSMKKSIYMLVTAILFGVGANSQTNDDKKKAIRDKIDKAVKHPDREKNSAKADARIFDKKTISRK